MSRKMVGLLIFSILASSPLMWAQKQKMSLCGPDIHYSTKKLKGRAAVETAPLPAGEAIVYVVRPTHYGALIQTKLAMDGQWMGINKANSYFVFLADPGPHNFCSESENASRLSLDLEAGKTYYLQQHIRLGINKARNKLSELDDTKGKMALARCRRMIFWEKGKPRPPGQ
ncbi:MAG: DUF2846 domain-containing protein [Candidatus Acidiferrales bacterium]